MVLRHHGLLLAHKKGQAAGYATPGSFDPNTRTIEAQFGSLGQVAMTFHRRGKRRLRLPCSGKSRLLATGKFTGTFSFTGEDGFTTVTADHAPAVFARKLYAYEHCPPKRSSGPGTHLVATKDFGSAHEIDINVAKKDPTARAKFSAVVSEAQGQMKIDRLVWGTGPSSSFAHNRRLTKATISEPPPPFSGEATFTRDRGPAADQWTGTLSASFPGQSNVALAGGGFDAVLYASHAG